MATIKIQSDKTVNKINEVFRNKVDHLYCYIYTMKKILEPKIQADADSDEIIPADKIIFYLLDSCEDYLEGLETEARKIYTKLEEMRNGQASSVRLMRQVGENEK